MADIRSTQNIAQIEWQDPPIMRSFQILAQIEYDIAINYDETLKLVNLTVAVSGNDSLNISETELSINIISTFAATDLQDYIDSSLLASLSIIVSGTDLQDYQNLGLLTSLIISTSSTDDITWEERKKLVEITFETSGVDALDAIENRTVDLTLSVSEANDQDFYDLNLSTSLAITVSCFDSVPVAESYKQVDMTLSIIGTDLLDAVEDVLVPLTLIVEGTSIIVFESEILTVPLTMNLSEIDVAQFIEDAEILLNITIGENDGYRAVSRSLFTLLSRTKLYQLVGRTKTYYLTKE